MSVCLWAVHLTIIELFENILKLNILTNSCTLRFRAEPKKKKKVDPRREQLARDRLRKKLKRLEKVPSEFIPIEDFITPAKCLDETRYSSFHCCTHRHLEVIRSDLCWDIVYRPALVVLLAFNLEQGSYIYYFSSCQQMLLKTKHCCLCGQLAMEIIWAIESLKNAFMQHSVLGMHFT